MEHNPEIGILFRYSQQIVDSQGVATQQKGRSGATMLRSTPRGCKRHTVVDVLGLILAVAVTGTNVQDGDGGQLVLKGLKDCFPRLARAWADGAYASRLVEWAEKAARVCARLSLADQRDGLASPSCHGVGSWIAWLGNYRRRARDYEISPRISEAWIKIATIYLMVRRLA